MNLLQFLKLLPLTVIFASFPATIDANIKGMLYNVMIKQVIKLDLKTFGTSQFWLVLQAGND